MEPFGLEGTFKIIQFQALRYKHGHLLVDQVAHRAHPAWPGAPPGVGMGTSGLSANKGLLEVFGECFGRKQYHVVRK